MKRLHKLLLNTTMAVGLVLTGSAAGFQYANAQTTAPKTASKPVNKVLAIVNGHKITTKEVKLAADDILPHLSDVPAKLRYSFIIEYLIERHLLAQQAIREGMGDNAEYKTRLIFYQSKALRDAYFTDKIKAKITEAKVRAIYDKQAKTITGAERFRARHILVGTEKEAKEVAKQLKAGANFETLAKQISLDGSKDFGGDLGYFTAEEMVKEFSAAAKSLKPGETSGPVKTEFGWHIIRMIDRKAGGPRPFDEVKTPIKLVLLRQAVQDKVNELRKTAKIEMVDPDLKRLLSLTKKKAAEIKKAQDKAKLLKKPSN